MALISLLIGCRIGNTKLQTIAQLSPPDQYFAVKRTPIYGAMTSSCSRIAGVGVPTLQTHR